MVEYKKRLINLKGGGTRNYYTKTYKNGNVVSVKKDEYIAKGERLTTIPQNSNAERNAQEEDYSELLEPNSNNLFKKKTKQANYDKLKSLLNIKEEKIKKGSELKNYIKGYVPTKDYKSKECDENDMYDLTFYKVDKY